MTAFGREQTLKMRVELTMYQECDNPERWTVTPTLPTGRPHWQASSPVELARLIESGFVTRETPWTEIPQAPLRPMAELETIIAKWKAELEADQ